MSICPVQLVKECDEASKAVQNLLSTLMRDQKFTEVDRLVSISVGLNAVVADVKARLENNAEEDN